MIKTKKQLYTSFHLSHHVSLILHFAYFHSGQRHIFLHLVYKLERVLRLVALFVYIGQNLVDLRELIVLPIFEDFIYFVQNVIFLRLYQLIFIFNLLYLL